MENIEAISYQLIVDSEAHRGTTITPRVLLQRLKSSHPDVDERLLLEGMRSAYRRRGAELSGHADALVDHLEARLQGEQAKATS